MGIPMRITSTNELVATCVAGDRVETVDLALVGPQPEGTFVLVFLGTAREVLSLERADLITKALDGLASALAGNGTGSAFADLEARGPQLPPHLEAARRSGATTA